MLVLIRWRVFQQTSSKCLMLWYLPILVRFDDAVRSYPEDKWSAAETVRAPRETLQTSSTSDTQMKLNATVIIDESGLDRVWR